MILEITFFLVVRNNHPDFLFFIWFYFRNKMSLGSEVRLKFTFVQSIVPAVWSQSKIRSYYGTVRLLQLHVMYWWFETLHTFLQQQFLSHEIDGFESSKEKFEKVTLSVGTLHFGWFFEKLLQIFTAIFLSSTWKNLKILKCFTRLCLYLHPAAQLL